MRSKFFGLRSRCSYRDARALGLAEQAKRQSLAEQVTAVLNGKKVTIDSATGRTRKGREIRQVALLGQVWRTGADEATVLTTEGNLTLGEPWWLRQLHAVYAAGRKNGSRIVNKGGLKQWGAYSYDDKSRTSGGPDDGQHHRGAGRAVHHRPRRPWQGKRAAR